MAEPEQEGMSGTEKAALLLMTLGEEEASKYRQSARRWPT